MTSPSPSGGIENSLPDEAFTPEHKLHTTLWLATLIAFQEAKLDDEWPDVAEDAEDAHRFIIPKVKDAIPVAETRIKAAIERIRERRYRTGLN